MSSQAKQSSAAAAMAASASETLRTPTAEEIAIRAYEIYESRGGKDGADLDDWLQAERELSQPAK
jgi:hypothetical protein